MKRLAAALSLLFFAAPLRAALYSVGLDKDAYTSDFMIGRVAVAVIFPESDGSLDPNTETWTDDRKTQALSKIMGGLDWWTRQNSLSPLSFTFVTQTVATKYEPITRDRFEANQQRIAGLHTADVARSEIKDITCLIDSFLKGAIVTGGRS